MIYKHTKLKVSDNSGARVVKCIGFWCSPRTRFVGLNDIIRVSLHRFNRTKFYTPRGSSKKKKSSKKLLIDSIMRKEAAKTTSVVSSGSKQKKLIGAQYGLNEKKKKGSKKKTASKRARIKKRRDLLLFIGIIISCSKMQMRADGTFFRTYLNRVVVLTRQLKFLGTKILGPLMKETRSKKNLPLFRDLVSFSSGSRI